ncbi:MAG: dephospho-CoA kinase [Thiolinea sp.]
MLKVGLTGGIGSGKSTVTEYFVSLGVPVVDADQVARDIVGPDQPALREIADVFGEEALDVSGTLDRAWLREQVFDNPTAREKLEAITHPRIKQKLLGAISEYEGADGIHYVIVDIPLLVEKGYQSLFDAIVVVDCTPEQQLERALQRDGSDATLIKGIMQAQSSRAERLVSATHVLDNTSTLESLYRQVDRLHEKFMQIAGI